MKPQWTATSALEAATLGKLPRTSRRESHWYATIMEEGCVLCGAGGRETRLRVPGQRPSDPRNRFASDYHDWACSDHFL